MYEQEKQRATHLIVLLVYTFLSFALIGESLLLGWEMGAVVLLLAGLIASWGVHITEKVSASSRLWLYFILSMLDFFFYGIHATSVYDMAPLMIVIILLFSATEKYNVITFCMITYCLTLLYDFLFVVRGEIELTSLAISRIVLHLVLVFLAGYLSKVMIKRRRAERKLTDGIIAELEDTNRRTEDFLTNVSHELRTPINVVTGITAVMIKNEENPEKRKDLSAIQVAGHRLFGQIGDILDYTEIDTGRIKVSENTYMITSLVNDIIVGNRLSEKENTLEMIFDIDAGIPSLLLGDEKKIKKILEHLIDNACKFTKEGGVYVRVYALQKPYGINLCLKVSDTGSGISGEELEKIKERFYQANGGRNRKAGGLGLGLSIVYGMVSAMEGFIQMESTEGKGTTVSVSIPQKIADDAPAMVLEHRENLCAACYLRPEKYKIPEIRDYYNEMISHLVQGLEISLHRVSNKNELEQLMAVYQLTHLFIGREEYEEDKAYFEELDWNIKVIVAAQEDCVLPQKSRIRLLKKPVYSLPIANLLNMGEDDTVRLKEKHMICPGVRALVVDDEPMNLMVAEGIFRDYQMNVTTAESGKRAIELCMEEDFDLIFLDHMMPEMDGVETLRQIRKIHTGQNKVVTVIAFTANAVSGAREMFLREGFDEFISKPIETLELERILKKMLPVSAISFVDEAARKAWKEKKASPVAVLEEKQREEKQEESSEDKDTRLEKAGIHVHSGMQYCCGDREFFAELLTRFAEDAAHKAKEIEDFFQQNNMDDYGIMVHALKSTAKMIGADALSEHAKSMEAAAKEHDTDYVTKHHRELMTEYKQVVQRICEVFDLTEEASEEVAELETEEMETEEISVEELLLYLERLKEGLRTFEEDKAETLLAEMDGVGYQGTAMKDLLNEVRQDVDEFEFSAASRKVELLMEKVKGGEAG